MKGAAVLILASLIAFSSAGIGEVDEKIEAEALRLWEKYCEGGNKVTEGKEENMYIYCKPSTSTEKVPVHHTASPPAQENPEKVIVFIRPPAFEYEHNVTLVGQGGNHPRTEIYVKPVENTHSFKDITDKRDPSPAEKPKVYYLKKQHGQGREKERALNLNLSEASVAAAAMSAGEAAAASATQAPVQSQQQTQAQGYGYPASASAPLSDFKASPYQAQEQEFFESRNRPSYVYNGRLPQYQGFGLPRRFIR